LEKAGRLRRGANDSDNTKRGTNVIPLRMKYEEMMERYRMLYTRLMAYRNIADRIKNKVRFLGAPPAPRDDSVVARIRILRRLLFHGLLPGGIPRIYHFLRSVPITKPRFLPLVIQDWIVGLSMRDYVARNFSGGIGELRSEARHRMKRIERAFRNYVREGTLELSLEEAKDAVMSLSLSLRGRLDRRFFKRAGKQLANVLENSSASVTLRIEGLHDTQLGDFRRLLSRLTRYGDRVSVAVREELARILEIDSSIFNLVVVQPALSPTEA
jgi:hypothetical protein